MTLSRLGALDSRLSSQLRIAERPRLLRIAASIIAHSADSWFWFMGLAAAWFLGPAGWRAVIVILFGGIIVTALLVFGIKFTVRRKRPEGEWGKIYRATDPHSFPSGHAARAVMLAVTVWGLGYAWWGLLLLIWALLVMAARVALGVHYLSDVIAGTILGVIIGLLVPLLL